MGLIQSVKDMVFGKPAKIHRPDISIQEKGFFAIEIDTAEELNKPFFVRTYKASNNMVYLIALRRRQDCIKYINNKLSGIHAFISEEDGVFAFDLSILNTDDYKKFLLEKGIVVMVV